MNRRGFITGLLSFLAAPAIVRASSLDVIRGTPLDMFEYREVSLGYVITRKAIESLQHGLLENMRRDVTLQWKPWLDVGTATGCQA